MTQSARKYFGTDGIRGTANHFPMTAEVALKLGMAAGNFFQRGSYRHRVVIAKDTRLSGYMIEPALTAGFIASGVDVLLVGPLPTPAVAMLTRSMRADLGVMISASHNPYYDNGIKLFGPDGYKLSDEVEMEIEAQMADFFPQHLTTPDKLGRAKRLEDARGRYIEFAKASFPRELDLTGLKVCIDCAHGAAYQVGPIILQELGAEVVAISVQPDGTNINAHCGSTHPEALQRAVLEHHADIGIALDGDADRLLVCDERGALVDGDQMLAMIATDWQQQGKLVGGGVIATQMSNLGFEQYLTAQGLGLFRTKVGDRYVMEAMREKGWNLGGEQSGHIIMTDYSTTGDGLVAALQILAVVARKQRPASEMLRVFEPLPQKLSNVRFHLGIDPLRNPQVQIAIAEAEAQLAGRGRLLIRKSGTEPLIRIMAESETEAETIQVVQHLVDIITQASHAS
jgi:phosphoglucosamine mutase